MSQMKNTSVIWKRFNPILSKTNPIKKILQQHILILMIEITWPNYEYLYIPV